MASADNETGDPEARLGTLGEIRPRADAGSGEEEDVSPVRMTPIQADDEPSAARRAWAERAAAAGSASAFGRDVEIAGLKKVTECINRLRGEDEAYVALYRIQPDRDPKTGRSCKGYTARWLVSDLRGVEDLLDRIRSEYGGEVWDVRFSNTKPNGAHGFFKSCRLLINAPVKAIYDGVAPEAEKASGGAAVISPDNHLVQQTFELLKEQIGQGHKPSNQELMSTVKEILSLRGDNEGSLAEFMKESMRMQGEQVKYANQTADKLRTEMLQAHQPNAELVRMQVEGTAQKIQEVNKDAKSERERLMTDFDRERTRYEERLSDYQRKLDDVRRDFEGDRVRMREEHSRQLDQERVRNDRELNQVRERHDRELADARSSQKAEISRLESLLDMERQTNRHQRDEFETRKASELATQKGIFETQLAGLTERLVTADRRITDLERARDDLQTKLLEERSNRPDQMSELVKTATMFKEVGGMLGMTTEKAAPKSEIAETLEALRDTGIIDGVKGIGIQLASALKRPTPAAQTPPYVVNYPVDPRTGMPVPQQQAAPALPSGGSTAVARPAMREQSPAATNGVGSAQGAAPPLAAPASQGPQDQQESSGESQQPAEQPSLPQQEVDLLAGIVPPLQEAMEEGRAVPEVAKLVAGLIPHVLVRNYLTNGVTEFSQKIEIVDPSSSLLTLRGEKWLRQLFEQLDQIVPAEVEIPGASSGGSSQNPSQAPSAE